MKLFSPARLAFVASITLAACAPVLLRSQAQDAPAYRNPKLPIEQRLADLLSRMTLEEKVAQLEAAGFIVNLGRGLVAVVPRAA